MNTENMNYRANIDRQWGVRSPQQKLNESFSLVKKSSSRGNLSNMTEATESSSFSEEDEIRVQAAHVESSPAVCLEVIDEDDLDADEVDCEISITGRSLASSSCGSDLPEGMPSEIIVLNDSIDILSSSNMDMRKRLHVAEDLLDSYKMKLKSTEKLADSLHEYLRQTQGLAENLLVEKNQLDEVVTEMDREIETRDDQSLFMKMIMCFGLFIYMCGGSEFYLVASVGVYLLADLISSCI